MKIEFDITGLDLLEAIVRQTGVTQSELATVVGIDQRAVAKLMTGARSLTVEQAEHLADHFKLQASLGFAPLMR